MTAPRESYLLDLLGVRSILDDDGEYYPSVSTLEYGSGLSVEVSEEGKRVKVSAEVSESDVEAALDEAKAYTDAALSGVSVDLESVLQEGSNANGQSISDLAHLGLVTEGEDSAAWTMSTGVATVQGYVGSNAPTFSAAAGDVYYRSNGSMWINNGTTSWRPIMQLLATSSAPGGIPVLNSGSLGRFQTRDDLKFDTAAQQLQVRGGPSAANSGYSLRDGSGNAKGLLAYDQSGETLSLVAESGVAGRIQGGWTVPSGSTLTVPTPASSGHAVSLEYLEEYLAHYHALLTGSVTEGDSFTISSSASTGGWSTAGGSTSVQVPTAGAWEVEFCGELVCDSTANGIHFGLQLFVGGSANVRARSVRSSATAHQGVQVSAVTRVSISTPSTQRLGIRAHSTIGGSTVAIDHGRIAIRRLLA